MTVRLRGAALGAALGALAMLAPLSIAGWFPATDGYLIPQGAAAAIGSAAAGFILATRALDAPASRLGLIAALFAVLVPACAAPLFAAQGAIWSVVIPPEPGDELFHPGPILSALFDVFVFGAISLVLAVPQGIAWVLLLRRLGLRRRAHDIPAH